MKSPAKANEPIDLTARAERAGAARVLYKPFEPSTLFAGIDSAA